MIWLVVLVFRGLRSLLLLPGQRLLSLDVRSLVEVVLGASPVSDLRIAPFLGGVISSPSIYTCDDRRFLDPVLGCLNNFLETSEAFGDRLLHILDYTSLCILYQVIRFHTL